MLRVIEKVAETLHCGRNKVFTIINDSMIKFVLFFHSSICIGMLLVGKDNTLLQLSDVR